MRPKGKVLITRPPERSAPLIYALKQMGFTPVCNPLLKITPTGTALPNLNDYQGIIFTSASAIPYCLASNIPVYTVGESTAAAARDAGFGHVQCGGSNVAALKTFLIHRAELRHARLLYPSAVDISDELVPSLPEAGPAIDRVAVYKTIPQPLQKTTIRHLYDGKIEWIVLFSRRTAEALGVAMTEFDDVNWTANTGIACLAPPVAEPVVALKWRQVEIAARPDQEALLACLASKELGR